MGSNNRNKKRPFYVVQFIELPFEGIDDYVCVPYTWLIVLRKSDQKAVVAYPKDEDPFDTRDRVKRKERYDDEWRFYMAAVKYESDTYRDAEYWIATRNDYGPLVEEDAAFRDTQPRFTLNKKLRNSNRNHSLNAKKGKPGPRLEPFDNPRKPLPRMLIKRPALPEPKQQHDEKRFRQDEAANSTSAGFDYANLEPGCSKREQSIIFRDQLMENTRTEETTAVSNVENSTEQSFHTQSTEQNEIVIQPGPSNMQPLTSQHCEQALSLPIINVDETSEVITIDEEDHSQPDYQPSETHGNSSLNFQPQIADVRPIAKINDNQKPRNDDVSNNEQYTSHHLLNSMKMAAQLYNHMKGARKLVPIQKTVEKRIHLVDVARTKAMTVQNPSNLMNQTGLSTRSVEKQPSMVLQNQSQGVQREPERHGSNSIEQTVPLRDTANRSTQSNNMDHRPNSTTIQIRMPPFGQSTNASNPLYPQQRQLQANHQDPRSLPRRPKIRVGISIRPKNNRQWPALQEVTKSTLQPVLSKLCNSIRQALTTDDKYLLKEQQARLSGRSTEQNRNIGIAPQNITAPTARDMHSSNIPTCSFYQSSRIQHTSAHEYVSQGPQTQNQLVDQSTETNLTKERFYLKDDVMTPVGGCSSNMVDSAYQTDECVLADTPSPYHGVASDSEDVTDHEVISDHEVSTDGAPVETTNVVDRTGPFAESNSADRLTAAHNSTPTNHQTNSRVVLEQQMLDNFAALFTQMGSTLRYTCDMYNNLRSSIHETANIYRQLLDTVERFNASNVSTFSHVTPEDPQLNEERQTEVTARENSSNGDQHSNSVNETPKKKHNNLWRFVLPIKYNPNDTKWTLKYRENMPGLVELMPQSHIYVSYGELKYCQKVSKNCKSLARRLLKEVFNRDALSVCLSMTEKAKASNNTGSNLRPELDEHAYTVLLNFVFEHGLQSGWNTDTQPVFSVLHRQIQEIRFKYGVMVKC